MKNTGIWTRASFGLLVLAAPLLASGQGASSDSADVLAADLDPAVKPTEDFFAYANGGWFKRNPIPASESSWGIGNLVQDEIYGRLRKISDGAAADEGPWASDLQRIGDFWAAAMDESLANRVGVNPLRKELARIDAVRDGTGVLDAAFAELPLQTGVFFSFLVAQDQK